MITIHRFTTIRVLDKVFGPGQIYLNYQWTKSKAVDYSKIKTVDFPENKILVCYWKDKKRGDVREYFFVCRVGGILYTCENYRSWYTYDVRECFTYLGKVHNVKELSEELIKEVPKPCW